MNVSHIKDLHPDPQNRRKHTPRNLGMLVDALHQVGAARSIVIDETGEILAGNGVVEAAAEAGLTKVQVVDVDGETVVAVRRSGLSAEQKRALAIYDNRVAELAEWDWEQLAKDKADCLSLQPWFSEQEQRSGLKVTTKGGFTRPDDVPPERETDIQSGDIFGLGQHRLLCGDCTSTTDVQRMIGDETVDCLMIDPPYCSGGFQEAGRSKGSVGTDGKRLAQRMIANDTLSTRGYQALLKVAIANVNAAMVYIFTDWRMWVNLFDVVESSGYGVRNMIVWDKGTPGMGVGWRTQHELILFGTKVKPGFDNHKAQGNVISCARTGNEHHATQKPVDLLLKVLAVTDMAETVVDVFAGSGSTLIACEQGSRKFLGMEMDPRHVQTAIDRWEAFTGQKAVKVGESVRA